MSLFTANAITMASKPDSDTSEALKPYTEIIDTKNEISARTTSSNGNIGFENKMIKVISIVNPILINMAFTLRFTLPGISPGALKKEPTAKAGAYSIKPNTYKTPKGITMLIPRRTPRSKSELFKNSSSCLNNCFKAVFVN